MRSLKSSALILVVLLAAGAAIAQVRTVGQIVGVVQDATGAVVLGAKVTLVDEETGVTKTTTPEEDGRFIFVDLPNGTYKLTTTVQGFKTAVYPGIKVDVGRTSEVTVKLEVGAVETSVIVEAGAEVLQTTTTAVESTITGRMLRSLPLNNRDVLDFVLLLPGAQQAGSARQSTFEGLPKGSINITLDGINIQDNTLKSSFGGGMFTIIRPKLDAVEEINVTTASAGAESAGEGAVQIKFVTRRGTNDWHGTTFWYYRDQGLNGNTWFNNAGGRRPDGSLLLPRPRNHLHQYGFNLGGPLIKDKLFIFGTFEDFKLPASQTRSNTILRTEAQGGIFRYAAACDGLPPEEPCPPGVTRGQQLTADVLAIAGGAGFPTTIDPTISTMFGQINSARSRGSVTPSGLFRESLRWDAPSGQRRWFPTVRVDYNISNKLRWHAVGNWNHFDSFPDTLNSMDPSLPGLPGGAGQYSRRWSLSTAVNWELRPNLTYELRLGRQRAPVRFFPEATDAQYPTGIRLVWPLGLQNLHTRPGALATTTRSLPSNRDTPATNWLNNVGWVKGKHTLNFGTSLSIYTHWDSSGGGFGIPSVTLGLAATDPAAGAFTNTGAMPSVPASSGTDLGFARALYATLVGRIASISGSRNVNEATKAYVDRAALTERNRQNEFGLYVTDSWRAFKTLTINAGLRWEYQGPPHNTNGIYTSPNFENLWGKSGVGNLFRPGTVSGIANPVIDQRSRNLYRRDYKNFAPSFGLAWTPGFDAPVWNAIFGGPGKTVIRSGYSIAFTREGLAHHTAFAGGNPGLTQSITLVPGDPGFSPGALSLTTPLPAFQTFPTSFSFPTAQSLFTFSPGNFFSIDPNLKTPYVQSWNFGIQRQLSPSMVLEARYVGNRGTRLWRGFNLNEVNILENSFLQEFINAQNNLNICAANRVACTGSTTGPLRFDNVGLAGQVNVPIFTAAFSAAPGADPSSTFGTPVAAGTGFANGAFVTLLQQGQAGALANSLASSPIYLCRMVGGRLQGCAARNLVGSPPMLSPLPPGAHPANFFQVNPDAANRGVLLLTNGSFSTYHGLQVELRRRMARGLMVMGNYVWSKSLTNMYADSASSQVSFTTLRDRNLDKGPSPWNIRHSMRLLWIYEMPFGPGRKWSAGNTVVNKVIEGWEVLGVVAVQSGRVFKLTSNRQTVNQFDSGVILRGMTTKQLQEMLRVVKTQPGSSCYSASAVFYADPQLLGSNCRANPSFLAVPTTPGEFGNYVYLYGPRFVKPDLTVAKKTKITERVTTEFRAEFFNAFNYQNFVIGGPGAAGITQNIDTDALGTGFGRTNGIFNDLGNQDQGPRMIQFVVRVSF